jgi:hypothetical protein
VFDTFDFSPLNGNLTSLALQANYFSSKALQQLSEFLKMQGSLAKVKIDVLEDAIVNGNDYKDIIKHILGLETLKYLSLCCKDMWIDILEDPGTSNPSVETLILNSVMKEQFDGKSLVRCFPETRALNLDIVDGSYFNNKMNFEAVDLTPLFCLNLVALKLAYVTDSMLSQLNFRKLREFQVQNYHADPDVNIEIWRAFFIRSPHLEILRLPNYINFQVLKSAFDYLPNLKKLQASKIKIPQGRNSEEKIQIFSEYSKNLESFQVEFRFHNNEEATRTFNRLSVDLKVSIKLFYRFGRIKFVFKSSNFKLGEFSEYF